MGDRTNCELIVKGTTTAANIEAIAQAIHEQDFAADWLDAGWWHLLDVSPEMSDSIPDDLLSRILDTGLTVIWRWGDGHNYGPGMEVWTRSPDGSAHSISANLVDDIPAVTINNIGVTRIIEEATECMAACQRTLTITSTHEGD